MPLSEYSVFFNDTINIFALMVMNDDIVIAGLDSDSLAAALSLRGVDQHHAQRLLYWIYRGGIRSFSEINDIPKSALAVLSAGFRTGLSDPVSSVHSSDGSVKYLFQTRGGLEHEAVYLPDGRRDTVCVSVQAGCRLGCRFCATGLNGWRGQLTAGEIINQVVSLPHAVTHVVMMGMGEPGDNIDEVIRAYRILTAGWGLSIGKHRVTVSTVGVTPAVRRLIEETECNITLSLHSPFAGERNEVIPAERTWPFTETLELMKSFRARRRRFTVAYVMIKEKNDTERHLEELKRLLSGTVIRVNLLSYHQLAADTNVTSDSATMMRFKHVLVSSGIGASIRRSRGADIAAACGMLAGRGKENELTINKLQI
jgi:23S rRNA (adenine2503-C2)-methyltransferase